MLRGWEEDAAQSGVVEYNSGPEGGFTSRDSEKTRSYSMVVGRLVVCRWWLKSLTAKKQNTGLVTSRTRAMARTPNTVRIISLYHANSASHSYSRTCSMPRRINRIPAAKLRRLGMSQVSYPEVEHVFNK